MKNQDAQSINNYLQSTLRHITNIEYLFSGNVDYAIGEEFTAFFLRFHKLKEEEAVELAKLINTYLAYKGYVSNELIIADPMFEGEEE